MKIPYLSLKNLTRAVFLKIECSPAGAEKATDVLLAKDLRGIDSHGVARLSYDVRLWKNGRINCTPDINIVHETPSTAVIDGGLGL